MPTKRVIAVLAVVLGGLVAVPVGAGAAKHGGGGQEGPNENIQEQCPPGVQDATYCAAGNLSGLSLSKHTLTTSNNSVVNLTLPCKRSTTCSGKLFLEGAKGKILGSVSYSIKPGKHATVQIRLTAAGRKALEKTGKLTIKLAAVSKGVRSSLGTLTIKGKKKH
jgi:hypothetical protein